MGSKSKRNPTPQEIEERAAAIREGWTNYQAEVRQAKTIRGVARKQKGILIRVTDEEREYIKAMADEAGVALQAFCLRVLLNKGPRWLPQNLRKESAD